MSKSSTGNLSDRIYRTLRERVVNDVIVDSTPLRQAQIAQEFGTSHIPVREAFSKLAAQGVLRVETNRGATIVPLAAHRLRELADMRIALELLAVRHCMPLIGDSEFKAARAFIGSAGKRATASEVTQSHWNFLRALFAPCDRGLLMQQMEALWGHADRYLAYGWKHAGLERTPAADYEALLVAFAEKDMRSATTLVRTQIEASAAIIEAHLRGAQHL